MSTASSHFGDELQGLLDKRLDANVRRSVESHVQTCDICRRELDAFVWARELVGTIPSSPAPAGLKRRVLSEIRTERMDVDRLSQRRIAIGGKIPFAIALIVLAGLAGVLVHQMRARPAGLEQSLSRDYRSIQSGELPLSVRSGDPDVVRAYFEGFDVPFPVTVMEPGSTGLELMGGSASNTGSGLRTLVAYRVPSGGILVSHASVGGVDELPAGAVVNERRGIRFHGFYTAGVTAVCWQEGPVLRAMAGDLPLEQLLELAGNEAR